MGGCSRQLIRLVGIGVAIGAEVLLEVEVVLVGAVGVLVGSGLRLELLESAVAGLALDSR